MDLITTICFLCGFGLLILGAELLVKGAAQFARTAGVSALVVGLTVVAYGTSAPELAVTVQSVLAQPPQPDLAIGNVVGSNISNVLLVLGISALIHPLVVSREIVREGVPVMIGASMALAVIGWDGKIARWEGLAMASTAILYTAYAVVCSRREMALNHRAPSGEARPVKTTALGVVIQLTLIVAGLALLVLGANWLVDGAVALSAYFGMSELIIGLTVVAVGTSLPEIATSIVAGLRGQRDLAVGNVVGSNIFNVLLVLGVTAVVAPGGVHVSPAALRFDIPVMIVVAGACLPIFFNGYRIARWEGGLFLAYYAAYLLYLILKATEHDALRPFSIIVLAFVAPLTAATILVLAWREAQRGRKAKSSAQ